MGYLEPASYELPFSDEQTSRDAAEAARRWAGPQAERVLAWFRAQSGGATQPECAAATGISRQSLSARCRGLVQRGELVKTTRRRGGCAVFEAR